MKKCILFLLTLILASVLIIGGCATPAPSTSPTPAPAPAPAPAAPIELKFAHHMAPGSWVMEQFLVPYGKKIEAATNGKVKVVQYPSESLAKVAQSIDAMIGGIIDINWIPLGYYPGRFPLAEVVSLPFLNLPNGMVNGKVVSGGWVNSLMMQNLYDMLPEFRTQFDGTKVLFLMNSNPYRLFSKKPITSMESMKGLKIKSQSGPPMDMLKVLGATPLLMGNPELYEALEKGLLDGVETNWSTIGSFKLYNFAKYYTDQTTTNGYVSCLMNLNKFNSLPADIQQAIMSVSGEKAVELAGTTAWSEVEMTSILDQAKKDGKPMEESKLLSGESEKWLKLAGQPIWDSWVADKEKKGLAGKKVLDTLLTLIQKYKVK